MREIPQGATVKIKHWRRVPREGTLGWPHNQSEDYELKTPYEIKTSGLIADPRGGRTEVTITTEDGKEVVGRADVYYRDTFSRSLGRQIATGRALKRLADGS